MKKKIVLIGANGLIGKTFIEEYSSKYKIIKCLKTDDVSKILKKNKPSIIFNSSGIPYDEEKMFDTNLLLVKKIIDYCLKNKCFFIHLGSSGEYGRHRKATSETSELRPTTIYEGTKAAASMLIKGYAISKKIKAVIVRPYCVFGYHSKQNLLIPMIINTIIKNTKMNIYKGVHDFIYVKDFIKGIDKIISQEYKCKPGEVINLGSGKQLTNLKVLKEIQKVFKRFGKGKFKIINRKYRSYDSDFWLCDINYSKSKYKFECAYTFREALIDIKNYYVSNK
jgi:nucleoside-diphosphate-sugar epimerase